MRFLFTVWTILAPVWTAGAFQVFFLDFDTLDSADPPESHHNYTAAERNQITAEMNAHFALLGMSVTNASPTPPFSTIFFNASVPGTSDGVDFRNIDKSDDARVNAKRMLDIVGIPFAEQTSEQIVRASINTAMHEALHLLGARHQDAFTLPVQGILPGSAPGNSYDPVYPGPRQAELSGLTFMALAGIFGITEEKLLADDLFISPRSATKALLGEFVSVTAKAGGNNSPFTAQPVEMTRFDIPNTLPADLELPEGVELPPGVSVTDLLLFAEAAVVAGTLDQEGSDVLTDYYAVPVVLKWPYTIEVHSVVLEHRTEWEPTDVGTAALRITPDPGTEVLDYYGTSGFNNSSFELIDPAIVDILTPMDLPTVDGEPFIIIDVFARFSFGDPPVQKVGDYEQVIYRIGFELPAELAIPALGMTGTNGSAVIEWADLGAEFILQETDDMVAANWTDSVATPVFEARPIFGRFFISEPFLPGWKFFRLQEVPPDP